MIEKSLPKQSNLLHVYLNLMYKSGKKDSGYRIFLNLVSVLRQRSISNPAYFILHVLDFLRPPLTIKSKQIAGAKVKIPSPMPIRQQYLTAMRWTIDGARKRDRAGRLRSDLLAEELIMTYQGYMTYSKKQWREFTKSVGDNRSAVKFLKQ